MSNVNQQNDNKKVSANDLADLIVSDVDKLLRLLEESDEKISGDKLRHLDPIIAKLRHKIKPASNAQYENKKNSKLIFCYVCKVNIWDDTMRHNVHTDMCWLCGNINASKRDLKKDLTGKIAIVTGGRIKIGFETAIRLLRNNCTVIVTSRFVDDCYSRYEKDPDFEKFKHNLFIYQLNILSGQNIVKFVEYIEKNFKTIDYLINNAAQTIKRPIQFFQHILKDVGKFKIDAKQIVHRDDNELKLLEMTSQMNNQLMIECKDEEIEQHIKKIFPENQFDQFGQQIDLRESNSWIEEADQVNIQELAELFIINSIGPFILATKLKPYLKKTGNDYSWIINVTSMEGVFNWDAKPSRHPHTNMAKAALNMFTRTSAQEYIKDNIVMVCVDTGWNNPQQPKSYDFQTPVDCVDGAARILDPIYKESKRFGILLKNGEKHPW